MKIFSLIGLFATVLGCVCMYLASPQQRWLASAWRPRPARSIGWALWMLGWLSLAQEMRPLTATFTLVTALMLALAALPYVGALSTIRRGR